MLCSKLTLALLWCCALIDAHATYLLPAGTNRVSDIVTNGQALKVRFYPIYFQARTHISPHTADPSWNEDFKLVLELPICVEQSQDFPRFLFYCILYFQARTHISPHTADPSWNEDFELDLEGSQTLRVLCYRKGPDKQGDILLGRGALEVRICIRDCIRGRGWVRGEEIACFGFSP